MNHYKNESDIPCKALEKAPQKDNSETKTAENQKSAPSPSNFQAPKDLHDTPSQAYNAEKNPPDRHPPDCP